MVVNGITLSVFDILGEIQLISLATSTLDSKSSRIGQFVRWAEDKFVTRKLSVDDIADFIISKIEHNKVDASQSIQNIMGDLWRSLVLLNNDFANPILYDIPSGDIKRKIIIQNLKKAVENNSQQARFLHTTDEQAIINLPLYLRQIAFLWLLSGVRISGLVSLMVKPSVKNNILRFDHQNKTSTWAKVKIPCFCKSIEIANRLCFACNQMHFPKLPISRTDAFEICKRLACPSGSFRRTLAATFSHFSEFLNSKKSDIRTKYVSSVTSNFGWSSEPPLKRYASGYKNIQKDYLPRICANMVDSFGKEFRVRSAKMPTLFSELDELRKRRLFEKEKKRTRQGIL